MKCFKLSLLTYLLVVSYFVLSGSTITKAGEKEDKNVCFRWAFGAIVGPKNNLKFVSITRDMTLKTGDQFKMLLELQKKCFVYVIYNSTQGEVYMLFPYHLQQFTTNYSTAKKYYMPQGDMWFELDENIGRETFYLLASVQRLIELEALFGKYISAGTVRKQELKNQILTEIRKIKRKHRKFTTIPERPVPIGGSVRGITKEEKAHLPDIATIAVEISANNFYSRTFTIDHQ